MGEGSLGFHKPPWREITKIEDCTSRMGVGFEADSLTLEQEMQCTFNVTFGRVLATIVALEKKTRIAYSETVFLF